MVLPDETNHHLPRDLLSLSLAAFAIIWFVIEIRRRNPRLPPGPPGLPFVGMLPFLDKNLPVHLAKLASKYGPIMSLRLGRKLCVVVTSPSLARELLKDQDSTFANRDPPTAALALPNGLHGMAWAVHGPQWRLLRKLAVGEMLNNTRLDAFYALRHEEVCRMAMHVERSVESPVKIREVMFETMFNVVTGMMWGKEEMDREFRRVVEDILGTFGRLNISDFFPFLARFDLQGMEHERKKVAVRLHRILDAIIDQRLAKRREGEAVECKDLLQALLLTTEKRDSTMALTRDHIKGLLLTLPSLMQNYYLDQKYGIGFAGPTSLYALEEKKDLVMAGMDTTAATMEWAMAEMIQHPEIMKKVQEEVDQVVWKNIIEETHLSKLSYLNAVVKETMRLHTVAPLMLPRTPNQLSTVGGYMVPKGTRVLLNMWAIQRDPEGWDQPLEFQPERFMSSACKWDYSGNDFNYFPFGSGRRICPRIPLADRMLIHALASLLHSFNWRLPDGTKLSLLEKFGTVMKMAEPLVIIPTSRSLASELKVTKNL